MLRKIFPIDSGSSFFNSFKIIFVSEGFQASESALFTSLCLDFSKRLLDTPPFNLTKVNSNWLNIYTSFKPSDNQGPAINTNNASNRTAFESIVNTNNGALSFNNLKITQHLQQESFRYGEDNYSFSEYLQPGMNQMGVNGTLIVLLLPTISTIYPDGAEFENLSLEDEYYFISTTADGHWHQVIIRSMCKLFGLADEFELAGADYLEPTIESRKKLIFYPNLQYIDTPPTQLTSAMKWYRLFSAVQRISTPTINSKSGDTSQPDHSLLMDDVSFDKPGFYEGGGGYRTKVYRSSKDCIMRRQIGNKLLPLREKKIALSPVSLYHIKNIIS
jgi:hypothetical protein